MKNFTAFFFFFWTFASLGALAHGQWHNGGILGHLLGFAGQRIQGFSGGRTSGNECISTESVSCISYHEDVCQEVNGRTQCEAIPKCQCVGRQKWTVRWEIWMCMCINMNVMIIITPPHAVHVLSQNKKGEVCGFSSLNDYHLLPRGLNSIMIEITITQVLKSNQLCFPEHCINIVFLREIFHIYLYR